MNQISAIVCFGVPESKVDMLIDATMGTPSEPVRWLVFGLDMHLLSALDRQWGSAIDLVLAMLPGTSAGFQDAALVILAREGVMSPQSVWERGPRRASRQLSPQSSSFLLSMSSARRRVDHRISLRIEGTVTTSGYDTTYFALTPFIDTNKALRAPSRSLNRDRLGQVSRLVATAGAMRLNLAAPS